MCLTDADFPKRIAFAFLGDIQTRFLDSYDALIDGAIAFQMEDFNQTLRYRMDYFTNNREALESLRAPALEEKVVDLILESAEVTEKTVSYDELLHILD